MDTLHDFSCDLANFSPGFFHRFSWGSWPWPHQLIFQWSGLSDQCWLKTAYSARDGAPRGVVSTPFCAKTKRNGPASVNQSLSKASQDNCHVLLTGGWHPPTSPFWLAQKLSSKQIATDLLPWAESDTPLKGNLLTRCKRQYAVYVYIKVIELYR